MSSYQSLYLIWMQQNLFSPSSSVKYFIISTFLPLWAIVWWTFWEAKFWHALAGVFRIHDDKHHRWAKGHSTAKVIAISYQTSLRTWGLIWRPLGRGGGVGDSPLAQVLSDTEVFRVFESSAASLIDGFYMVSLIFVSVGSFVCACVSVCKGHACFSYLVYKT